MVDEYEWSSCHKSPDDGAQTTLVLVVRADGGLPTPQRAEDHNRTRRTRHGRSIVVVDEGVAVVTRIRSAHLGVAVEVGDSGGLAEDDLTL